jgi:hypothetical protein
LKVHKAAYLVRFMAGDKSGLTPEGVHAVLDLLLSDKLPPLESSLDRWWEAIVRKRREEVKRELLDTFGSMCECCEERLGTDLHEVFQRRSADTTWRQLFLFSVSNCALVCPQCHGSARVSTDEFKERIRLRRGGG